MNADARDDPLIIRYLLGQAGPEEQALVEERYLANPDYHDEIRAAERDLIDRYVRGELADREAFERQYLQTPARRERVEFARALAQWSARPSAVRYRLVHSVRPWQAAAAIAILAAGSWLAFARRDRDAQPAPAAPASQPAPQQRGQPATIVTFVLTPDLTRSGDGIPTIETDKASDVRLQLDLESVDAYVRYRALVRTADGREVWSETELTPLPTSSGRSLAFTVPAARLTEDDYTIRVSGVTGSGETAELSGYAFRVRTP